MTDAVLAANEREGTTVEAWTEEQLRDVERPHQPDYDSIGGCVCGEVYPCDTRVLVAEVRRLRRIATLAASSARHPDDGGDPLMWEALGRDH